MTLKVKLKCYEKSEIREISCEIFQIPGREDKISRQLVLVKISSRENL